jgi:hypothetical protein
MHGFVGKGHSEIYTGNMKNVIESIKKEKGGEIIN